jgi:hypothetical protein
MNIVSVDQVTIQPRGDGGGIVVVARPAAFIVTSGGQGPVGPAVTKRILAPAFSVTPTVNWDLGDVWKMTLTANITALTFAGGYDEQSTVMKIKQGGAGGYTVAQPSNVRCPADIPWPTLTATVGKFDRLGFMYDADDSKWDLVALAKGY